MSESKRSIVLLSASPKTNQEYAVSEFLAKRAERQLQQEQIDVNLINVRHALLHHETQAAFEAMQRADAVVLFFPLYIFCMPALLTRFLQDYYTSLSAEEMSASSAKVYAFINCGFPETGINAEAVRVVESFSGHVGMDFRFGVMIGGGGMMLASMDAPFIKAAHEEINRVVARIQQEVLTGEIEQVGTISIAPKFPRKLYFLGGNFGWKSAARKNGLKTKDLYRRPYQS